MSPTSARWMKWCAGSWNWGISRRSAPPVTGKAVPATGYVPVAKRAKFKTLPSNALMTLQEFLQDYASDETRKLGEACIREELAKIPKEKVREICRDNLEKIRQGQRDFRF